MFKHLEVKWNFPTSFWVAICVSLKRNALVSLSLLFFSLSLLLTILAVLQHLPSAYLLVVVFFCELRLKRRMSMSLLFIHLIWNTRTTNIFPTTNVAVPYCRPRIGDKYFVFMSVLKMIQDATSAYAPWARSHLQPTLCLTRGSACS